MEKLAVFVPCFNEARRIGKFVSNLMIPELESVAELIVIDNASEDSSLEVLKRVKNSNPSLSAKMKIFECSKNYGVGGSQKMAFEYMQGKNFSHGLIIPSNYKGNSGQILRLFLDKQKQNPEADVILGFRQFEINASLEKQLLNLIGKNAADQLKVLASDFNISDIGSRFMLFSCSILSEVPYKQLSDGPTFNLEFNILLGENKNIRIIEIPLKKWKFVSPSTAKQLQYSTKIIKTLSKYSVNKFVFQLRGWRLFADFPDNTEREFEEF